MFSHINYQFFLVHVMYNVHCTYLYVVWKNTVGPNYKHLEAAAQFSIVNIFHMFSPYC